MGPTNIRRQCTKFSQRATWDPGFVQGCYKDSWDRFVHYLVHKSVPMVCVVNQENSSHMASSGLLHIPCTLNPLLGTARGLATLKGDRIFSLCNTPWQTEQFIDIFRGCKAPYTLSVKLCDFTVRRHTWRKNWVNCAVLGGKSAGLRTVLSSRLSHRELRSSLRESHNFLSWPADTTMAYQGTQQNWQKKLTNLMGNLCCAIKHFVQGFLHGLTL
jgi:hypothetical protein